MPKKKDKRIKCKYKDGQEVFAILSFSPSRSNRSFVLAVASGIIKKGFGVEEGDDEDNMPVYDIDCRGADGKGCIHEAVTECSIYKNRKELMKAIQYLVDNHIIFKTKEDEW